MQIKKDVIVQNIVKVFFLVAIVYEVIQAINKLIAYILHRYMSKNSDAEGSEQNHAMIKVIQSIAKVFLWILGLLLILQNLGINVTSLIASLGIGGLAIALALQSVLSDMFSSFSLYIDKPFKAGDFIEAQGFMGTVNEIQIFNTILKTPDNKTIIIPNGGLSTGPMTNFSTEPTRRVDFSFGIGYSDDIDKARSVIDGLIKADSRIHNDPAPFIAIGELADSSVNFTVRVWADAADYWGIHFDLIESVKKTFDKEGISIPFPQTDVHLFNEK